MKTRKAQRVLDQTREFLRDYTAGVEVDQLPGVFKREAADVYEVLARDLRTEEEPEDDFKRFLHRTKILFLGLSYKLTPPRRILFLACLVLALLGLLAPSHFDLSLSTGRLSIDFSPLLFLASIAGLLYLVAMELVDRVRVRDELEVARQLQADLLPRTAPEVPGYAFAHSYRTANTIGGDYYDFLPLPDGRLVLVVGDASGHGMAAGLLMAIANASLKTALDLDPSPEAVVKLLNRALWRTGDRRAFMTLFYGLLEPDGGRLRYVCAGHPFPLVRRAGGEIVELGEGSLPLGIRPEHDTREGEVRLDPGDLLVMFSDGLPEAVSPAEVAFGFERLRGLLAQVGSPARVHDRLLLAFDQHVGQEPLRDDLTLVVVAREALDSADCAVTEPVQLP